MTVLPANCHGRVEKVRIVCHTIRQFGTPEDFPNVSANHWTLFFLLAGNKSVQFDMIEDEGDEFGTLKIKSCDYQESHSTIVPFDFEVNIDFTVEMAHEYLVNERHYNEYSMSDEGSGCRYWIQTVVGALAEKRWIAKDDAELFYPHLLSRYSSRMDKTILEMDRGWFSTDPKPNSPRSSLSSSKYG